jgi:hypothetical protein
MNAAQKRRMFAVIKATKLLLGLDDVVLVCSMQNKRLRFGENSAINR